METIEAPEIDLQEILEEEVHCDIEDCGQKAIGVTFHDITGDTSKCYCLECGFHFIQDKVFVAYAITHNLIGHCNHCGEDQIDPNTVQFREL